jgi:ubiquinone/menaquinone biosynthesis C-methylase UbiE
MATSEPQTASQKWWEKNPMTYDWRGTLTLEVASREWFEEIDRRFLASAYYARAIDGTPFGRFLKREVVGGKAVLEVGCGMGTHAAMIAQAGANLTAIDITERAVAIVKRRFEIFGLAGQIKQADCEQLPFPDASFSLVWSWGVIHHSSVTERCLDEITRVLRPGGRLMLMVYYKPSIVYYVNCGLIRGVLGGQLLYRSLKEIYRTASDGFYARVFTKKELRQLLKPYYEQIVFNVVGLKAELLPIPRCRLKDILEKRISDRFARAILSHWGSMIVIEAVKKSG